jgi:hypothetical protein
MSIGGLVVALVAVWALVSSGDCGHADAAHQRTLDLKLRRVRKLRENAFYGDIIPYQGALLVAFRDSTTHEGPGGKVTILRSTDDGESWKPNATLEVQGASLFDPHFCILADGRLLLHGGIRSNQGGSWGSYVAFASERLEWSEPKRILEKDQWLWRLTPHSDGHAYGVVYGCPPGQKGSKLLKTKDGLSYERVADLLAANYPNEATIRFEPDGSACVVHRHEESGGHALLGTSKPPYTEWTWKDLGRFIGGPNLLHLPSGQWLVGGRCIEKPVRLQLGQLDVAQGRYTPVLDLPSGGDCSYPGFLLHRNRLWVTYYSSHEGATSLYLAEVDLVAPATSQRGLEQTDVFLSGTDGCHTYRIPALAVTRKGTVLAFCEGRRKGQGDAGDIDIVLKRSADGGKT